MRNGYNNLARILKEIGYSGDLGVGEKIIFKFIFKTLEWGEWTGFMWLIICTIGRFI
jgi:hypothetical protein